jgi:hypothetical protein
MTDKRAKIIEKIQKLLRLSKSKNEHEAALAAARAQELLAKYNLDEADLTEREIPKEACTAKTETVKKPAGWVYILASSVAGAFDCSYFHSSWYGTINFIGVDADHEIANFTFGYLYRTINRLASGFMAKSQQKRLTAKGKKKVRLSYCLGAAQVVSQRLQQQKALTPITTTALIPVKKALIEAKRKEYGVVTEKLKEEDLSDRAFWLGRRDGASIDHGRRAMPVKKTKPLRIGHRG